KRILPLTAGHGLGLNVFGEETRLAQQESRERVPRPSPRRDVAVRSRGARAKAEPALQAVVAELGLAVIQFQLDDVNANSHFMLGEDLRESAAEAPVDLLAEQRHPVGRRADGVPVLEGGQAAGAVVFGIVHAGNPEIQAEVLSEVRSGYLLVHAVI